MNILKPLAIAALSIATMASAIAQENSSDDFPYKEDGPERDFFLQTFIRSCTQNEHWLKVGASEKETTNFCNCKALYTADIWTREDDLEWHRSKVSHTKVPASIYEKWQKANMSCQKHFSKLPKVPERKK